MALITRSSTRDLESDRKLSKPQLEVIRAGLVTRRKAHAAEQAELAALLAVLDGAGDPTSRHRAMVALRMYCRREAIEQIDDTLARVGGDDFGICDSCNRAIPFEVLETRPHMRTCDCCASASVPPLTLR